MVYEPDKLRKMERNEAERDGEIVMEMSEARDRKVADNWKLSALVV